MPSKVVSIWLCLVSEHGGSVSQSILWNHQDKSLKHKEIWRLLAKLFNFFDSLHAPSIGITYCPVRRWLERGDEGLEQLRCFSRDKGLTLRRGEGSTLRLWLLLFFLPDCLLEIRHQSQFLWIIPCLFPSWNSFPSLTVLSALFTDHLPQINDKPPKEGTWSLCSLLYHHCLAQALALGRLSVALFNKCILRFLLG